MAVNHAETSILIDGVCTHNMSDDRLLDMYAHLAPIKDCRLRNSNGYCFYCARNETAFDVVTMELQARGLIAGQEQGQAV